MKRWLSLLLAALLVCSLVSCGNRTDDGKTPGEGDPTTNNDSNGNYD